VLYEYVDVLSWCWSCIACVYVCTLL